MDLLPNRPEYLVGSHPVPTMSAAQEHDRAQAIRALRKTVWMTLLAEPKWLKSFGAPIVEALRGSDHARLADEIEALANKRVRKIGPKWTMHSEAVAARLVAIDPLSVIAESELVTRTAAPVGTPGRDPALPRRLRAAVRALIDAKQTFVLANLGLVFKVAGRFRGRGLPFLDLVQEGNLGLMRAVDLFDPDRGFRFSTYAVWWIRHAIDRALADRGRNVRVPVHLVSLHRKAERVRRRMEVEKGRSPSATELAAIIGAPKAKIELADLALSSATVSIDPHPTEERVTPIDLPDVDPLETLEVQLSAEGLDDLLDTLSDFEADIVRKRYGLGAQDPMTLQEIGEEYALSRERIRQIEKRALGRMRRAWRH